MNPHVRYDWKTSGGLLAYGNPIDIRSYRYLLRCVKEVFDWYVVPNHSFTGPGCLGPKTRLEVMITRGRYLQIIWGEQITHP